jgi:hypothetical protein
MLPSDPRVHKFEAPLPSELEAVLADLRNGSVRSAPGSGKEA